MASKILFIEDQLSGINSTILIALKKSDYISDKEMSDLVKAKTIHDLNDILSRAHLNFIEFAETFTDALERIQNAGRGSEYCWFFIDRNLGSFPKILTPAFDDKFYNYFGGFEGDYLYIRLLQAGVPKEKICFLTANDPKDRPFTSSVFFKDSHPLYVIKAKPDDLDELDTEQTSAEIQIKAKLDDQDELDESTENDLVKKLKYAGPTKIRFKYKKIFGNLKIQALLGKKMEDFIELLARIEYPEGAAGLIFDEGDGILLRNMIEWIVALLSKSKTLVDIEEISVRNFLNDSNNSYTKDFYFPPFRIFDIVREWKNALKNLHHFPKAGDEAQIKAQYKKLPYLNRPEQCQLNQRLEKIKDPDRQTQLQVSYNSALADYRKFGSLPDDEHKKDFIAKKIIQYTTTFFVHVLTKLYFSSPQDPDLPPKYIFSYIDNIYTVTSEWSAHGGNPNKVTDLSAEGFRALVYGMCQILDWLADKYPNQANDQ